MSRSVVAVILGGALWLMVTAVVQAQLFPSLPFDSRQFTFEVVSQDHLRLTGEVELTGSDDEWQFFADRVDVLTDQQLLVAEGNVVYVGEGARVAADRAEIRLEDLTGTFYAASGSVNMGDEVERSMFGTQEPDLHFYGETIEKLGPRTYRLTRGGFTSCVQPTPRWEMTSSSMTLNLDEYARMRNMVLYVKSVPVFYLPAMFYPIQDEGRATGFLMPTYGASTFRGTSLSNAFFWAISRSQDATFFHDWFTTSGQGRGAEYRYIRGPGSQGNLRTYFLNENETESSGVVLPARRSFEIRGDAREQISSNLTARANINFFSDVTVQQTFHSNILEASNRQRSISGNVSGVFGAYQVSGTVDSNETFFGDRSATLWGGGPRLSFGQGQKEIPGTPFYYSFDTEYVRMLRTRTDNPGAVDCEIENVEPCEFKIDSGLHRLDFYPVLQIPFTRWPFLTVNSSLAVRSTYWTERIGPVSGEQFVGGIGRNFVEWQSRVTGPSFVKIWDTPGTDYSERLKHLIEPFFTLRRVSNIEQFDAIVQLEGIDSIVGGVTQFQYGANTRIYGRGGSLGDIAREILTVSLNQSYYTDARAAQFDRQFRTSFNSNGASRSNLTPLSLTVRSAPTDAISASLRTEYDTTFMAFRSISAEGSYETGGWFSTSVGWSQRRFVEGLPGFDDPDRLDHYLNSSTSIRNLANTLGGAYRFNYDMLGGQFLQQRLLMYYNAQCCGVSAEYQSFNFRGLGLQRSRIPEDKRFSLTFTLAGLGTFANVLGAFGVGQGGEF